MSRAARWAMQNERSTSGSGTFSARDTGVCDCAGLPCFSRWPFCSHPSASLRSE